ncbi:MAG: transcriptional regulator, partial [Alphaproteobacteria bacterium]
MNKFELKSLLDDGALGTPAGRIVRMLTERGAMSAAQLSRLTGLAKSTVSTAVSELRRSGMVLESGSESGGSVGRPARALTLNPGAGTCIGILIGQT